jgi:hypothetical protein
MKQRRMHLNISPISIVPAEGNESPSTEDKLDEKPSDSDGTPCEESGTHTVVGWMADLKKMIVTALTASLTEEQKLRASTLNSVKIMFPDKNVFEQIDITEYIIHGKVYDYEEITEEIR